MSWVGQVPEAAKREKARPFRASARWAPGTVAPSGTAEGHAGVPEAWGGRCLPLLPCTSAPHLGLPGLAEPLGRLRLSVSRH